MPKMEPGDSFRSNCLRERSLHKEEEEDEEGKRRLGEWEELVVNATACF